MLSNMAGIVLVTGPQAAGKTTVSAMLARRFERGVHLDGDAFRRFVVAGRAEMTPDASDEALAQLRLRYRITASAAQAYLDAGFDVVVDDVVAGPMLAEVIHLLGIDARRGSSSCRRVMSSLPASVGGARRGMAPGRSTSFASCSKPERRGSARGSIRRR